MYIYSLRAGPGCQRLSVLVLLESRICVYICYMSYRFVDSFRTGPGRNCSSILVLFESCMTYSTAECTVNKLLIMDRGTIRNV